METAVDRDRICVYVCKRKRERDRKERESISTSVFELTSQQHRRW